MVVNVDCFYVLFVVKIPSWLNEFNKKWKSDIEDIGEEGLHIQWNGKHLSANILGEGQKLGANIYIYIYILFFIYSKKRKRVLIKRAII